MNLHGWHGDKDEFSAFSSLMRGVFNRYLKSSYVWFFFLPEKYYSKLVKKKNALGIKFIIAFLVC